MYALPRRAFLSGAGCGLLTLSCGAGGGSPKTAEHEQEQEDVAPPEDLMREHGALNRILLIYDDCGRRLEAGQALPAEALGKSADIVRRFIEQYHEQLEEDFVFPRFEKAGKLAELVTTLRAQHRAGRALTEVIVRQSANASPSEEARRQLQGALRAFARMYRPHEAREDTVLFPAFRTVVSAEEFHELGERFEDKEHELFGKEGFEGIVKQVAAIEQSLGLLDLDQFTPAVSAG